MRPILALLLLVAPAVLARDPFPADYQPSPCATPEAITRVKRTFPQSQMSQIAVLRGYTVSQEWVDLHWNELNEALAPIWAKTTTCYVTASNDNFFCNDLLSEESFGICNRFPEGSADREKCIFTMTAILGGQDHNSKEAWESLRSCATANQPAGERTLDWWISPATFDEAYPGYFQVFATDSETRVPVQGRLHIQSTQQIYADDVPNGLPTTSYKVPWKKPQFVRVPNAQGHRDVIAPEVRIEAPGYKTVTFRLPMTASAMKVEMKPAKLKRGKNSVTVTAVDAVTGKPIEARVMGGQHVLGKTNVPFEVEVTGKRPEIWVTNLYDRYNDVVVAPGEK